jgi:hypothetical protein
MQRQLNIILQSHNTNPLQEEVLMKNLTHTLIVCQPCMLAKGHITPKEGSKELDHLSSNNPSKVRTI